jgi:hypothetical protein
MAGSSESFFIGDGAQFSFVFTEDGQKWARLETGMTLGEDCLMDSSTVPSAAMLGTLSKKYLTVLIKKGSIKTPTTSKVPEMVSAVQKSWAAVCSGVIDVNEGSNEKAVEKVKSKTDLITMAKTLGITHVVDSKDGKNKPISIKHLNQDLQNAITKKEEAFATDTNLC